MIFNLSKEIDRRRLTERVKVLCEKQSKRVELIEKKQRRTIQQNKYIHLLFTWFAIEYGETIEYVKQVIFKQLVNPELFKTEYVNRKTGEVRESWKSTADLDTKQMTLAVDRFRNYASKEAGIYLPEADEREFLENIEQEVERYKEYI